MVMNWSSVETPGKNSYILGINNINKTAFFSECKYQNEVIDLDTVELLIQRSELFPKRKKKEDILYSMKEFSSSVLNLASQLQTYMKCFTLETLYDLV